MPHDFSYETPHDYPTLRDQDEIPRPPEIDLDAWSDIIISEKPSRAIKGESEFASLGSEIRVTTPSAKTLDYIISAPCCPYGSKIS